MHGFRKDHSRSHLKRQDLVPVLSDVLGNPLAPSVPLGVVTSILPLGSSSTSSTTSSSTSFPFTSSSLSSSLSLSSTSSPSTSSTTSATSTTPTPSSSVYETTSGGSVHTVTTIVNSSPSPTATIAPVHQSFLQNKALSGTVFALAGIAGLVIIVVITAFALRRTRKKRLLREAVSFDPVSINGHFHHGSYSSQDSMEKRSISTDNHHDFAAPTNQERSQGHGYGVNYTPGSFGHPNHNM